MTSRARTGTYNTTVINLFGQKTMKNTASRVDKSKKIKETMSGRLRSKKTGHCEHYVMCAQENLRSAQNVKDTMTPKKILTQAKTKNSIKKTRGRPMKMKISTQELMNSAPIKLKNPMLVVEEKNITSE